MHCEHQRHLGLCLGYVPALAYGSCRVSGQGTTLRASDLHNARATILNPFNKQFYHNQHTCNESEDFLGSSVVDFDIGGSSNLTDIVQVSGMIMNVALRGQLTPMRTNLAQSITSSNKQRLLHSPNHLPIILFKRTHMTLQNNVNIAFIKCIFLKENT